MNDLAEMTIERTYGSVGLGLGDRPAETSVSFVDDPRNRSVGEESPEIDAAYM